MVILQEVIEVFQSFLVLLFGIVLGGNALVAFLNGISSDHSIDHFLITSFGGMAGNAVAHLKESDHIEEVEDKFILTNRIFYICRNLFNRHIAKLSEDISKHRLHLGHTIAFAHAHHLFHGSLVHTGLLRCGNHCVLQAKVQCRVSSDHVAHGSASQHILTNIISNRKRIIDTGHIFSGSQIGQIAKTILIDDAIHSLNQSLIIAIQIGVRKENGHSQFRIRRIPAEECVQNPPLHAGDHTTAEGEGILKALFCLLSHLFHQDRDRNTGIRIVDVIIHLNISKSAGNIVVSHIQQIADHAISIDNLAVIVHHLEFFHEVGHIHDDHISIAVQFINAVDDLLIAVAEAQERIFHASHILAHDSVQIGLINHTTLCGNHGSQFFLHHRSNLGPQGSRQLNKLGIGLGNQCSELIDTLNAVVINILIEDIVQFDRVIHLAPHDTEHNRLQVSTPQEGREVVGAQIDRNHISCCNALLVQLSHGVHFADFITVGVESSRVRIIFNLILPKITTIIQDLQPVFDEGIEFPVTNHITNSFRYLGAIQRKVLGDILVAVITIHKEHILGNFFVVSIDGFVPKAFIAGSFEAVTQLRLVVPG